MDFTDLSVEDWNPQKNVLFLMVGRQLRSRDGEGGGLNGPAIKKITFFCGFPK